MAASPPIAEPDDELTRLRRRAYGAGGDIGVDAVALARLRELEEAEHERRVRQALAGEWPAQTGPETTVRTAATGAPPEARGFGRTARDWRTWVIAALVAGVVVAAMLGVQAASEPRPYLVLQPDETVSVDLQGGDYNWVAMLDIDTTTLHGYQSTGAFRPWRASRTGGGECLLIVRDDGGLSTYDCVDVGMEPIIDFDLANGPFAGLPSSGTARFAARGDVIEVWLSPSALSATTAALALT